MTGVGRRTLPIYVMHMPILALPARRTPAPRENQLTESQLPTQPILKSGHE